MAQHDDVHITIVKRLLVSSRYELSDPGSKKHCSNCSSEQHSALDHLNIAILVLRKLWFLIEIISKCTKSESGLWKERRVRKKSKSSQKNTYQVHPMQILEVTILPVMTDNTTWTMVSEKAVMAMAMRAPATQPIPSLDSECKSLRSMESLPVVELAVVVGALAVEVKLIAQLAELLDLHLNLLQVLAVCLGQRGVQTLGGGIEQDFADRG